MSTSAGPDYTYVGSELELFGAAHRWKRYLRQQIRPYLKGRVLEVGAGLGATARALSGASETEWVCLEPDPALASQVDGKIRARELPAHCRSVVGTTATCADLAPFDTVLYVDVLEHIQDDRSELARACALLAEGGHLIVLAPAHQWLYTPFDRAIGHHRRYSRRALTGLDVPGLRLGDWRYLDSAGLLASVGNRVFLRSPMPTPGQIRFWDSVLVRISQFLDPVTRYRAGKSVMVVWEKAASRPPLPPFPRASRQG